jgi:hypothetical protein
MEPQHDFRNNVTHADLPAFQPHLDNARDEGARAAVGGTRPADPGRGTGGVDAYTAPKAIGLPPACAKQRVTG